MAHEIYRVVSFEKVAPFTLRLHFDDGVSQLVDFRPVLKGELYGPLQDLSLFDQVQIDPEVHTLVWPNGADFDPAILHNWAESSPALKALQRSGYLKARARQEPLRNPTELPIESKRLENGSSQAVLDKIFVNDGYYKSWL